MQCVWLKAGINDEEIIWRFLWVLIALVFLVYSFPTFAQGIVTGSISGTVEDPSSAVIVGAVVTATQQRTNASFKTVREAGSFQIPGMPTGAYTVAIQAPGLSDPSRDQCDLRWANSSRHSDTENRQVRGGDGGGRPALLQPDSVQVSQTFDTQKVADLPIGNGFDIVALFTGCFSFGGQRLHQ